MRVSAADDRFCRECGASLVERGELGAKAKPIGEQASRRRGRGRWIGGAVALIVLLGGGGAGAAVKINHDHHVAKQRTAAEARHARDVAAAKARRQAAAAKAAADRVQRSIREDLERALDRSITKDASKQVAAGLLDGPITRTSCNAMGGGSDSLSEPTGRYECIAVNKTNADGTEEGYRYSATINYDQGSYTWHLGGE